MLSSKDSNPFLNFRWHRLKVTLRNIRLSSRTTAHPISIFEAIVKAVSSAAENKNDPNVFFHLKNKKHTLKIHKFEEIPLEFFFFQCDLEYAKLWREVLGVYLSDLISGRNFEIVKMGDIEERSYESVEKELGIINSEGEICLEFLTAFPFKSERGNPRTFISKSTFIQSFEKRFSDLLRKKIAYKSRDDQFSILPYYWNYSEIRHPAVSQKGQTQYINGCVGKLYIKGSFKDFLPFLILGSELHTGQKLSNSQGYYRLLKDSPPYFQTPLNSKHITGRGYFPNRKAVLSTIHDVLERYDDASEILTKIEGFSFNENEYAEKLALEISDNTYLPSPNTAFSIKKKDGTDRLVEKLNFTDLIIQQYLAKTVSEVFDRIFEESSIGFRKGISREKAVKMIQSAISEGYQYVIEADIEDFFSSVDLNILTNLLDFYIPKNDGCLKNILIKSINNGYILQGNFYPRLNGIAQGSPLSPLMANLYLDSFDEKVKKWGAKIIRYADDFLIFTRSREEAENIVSKTECLLSELHLKIKKEKTAIKPIKEEFLFLGIKFKAGETELETEEVFKGLKKPLYITESYLFLSINGDAIEIKKQGTIIETIPLRRISEIMVMERAAFSTILIKKCAQNNIPFTITLDNGYYITTVKPDSKRYYNISFEHGRKYYSLSETEILVIAKEFAIGKIKNYIPLFKQRYIKGEYLFIKELETVIEDLQQSNDIFQARGIEGAAAKKIYRQLNEFIDDPYFYFKKRTRRNPDPINSLFNFGYYLLFSNINATVRATGLNPYLGFLHSPADNYESLVCDIQELFRPRIARFLIRLANLKIIAKDDFWETERGFYLKKESAKKFINQFEAEMSRKTFKNELSLKENIYVQIAIIKKWILENDSLSFYAWKVE